MPPPALAQETIADTPPPPHARDAGSVIEALGSDLVRGLCSEEASRRLARLGPNELAEAPPAPKWRKLLAQFKELVIWILIVAAMVSGAVGEWADTAAILAIVLLNGLIGFLQEERAESVLAALQKLSAPLARVIRGGTLQMTPARELVPGDRIELEAGDNVPTDARLVEAFGFRVQEAALTGESVPVDKTADALVDESAPLGDRRNMVYMGTICAAGRGGAVVVATGMRTELGQIAGMLQRYEPEPTPLQRRLAELGKVLAVVCLVIVAVIFVLQLRRGPLLDVFLMSVSLAVAAVPEGLPAVVTMSLALGLQRMVRRNALVRKLPSVETLGSVTVICSDKTGTLTRNEMTVREVLAGRQHYQVTGTGYAPHGRFFQWSADQAPLPPGTRLGEGPSRGASPLTPALSPAGRGSDAAGSSHEPVDPSCEPDLIHALTIAARCNNASVGPRGNGGEAWQVIGDPTEGALLVAALKAGVEIDARPHVLFELPFDSERKAMSVVIRGPKAAPVMYTKGAPEVILAKSVAERRAGQVEPLSEARRAEIQQTNAEMAGRALRVLALAYRESPPAHGGQFEEGDLVFAGLVGMIDPPRDEAKDAVRKCRDAGIRPIMITGDHPATAVAIARELHIAGPDDRVVAGDELSKMSDDELAAQVEQISVYARVSAEHKLRVVRAWKKRGDIVAMTGDGVNDAPAVKAADIGIAMGISGTDVTKQASDMVLTDDNFASIVSAVEEGRGIFDNIQKVLQYLLSCNTGEILLMLVAGLLGWPAPLLPIQLLWINLVTDGLPALALSLEPPEPDVMRRKPRRPNESILSLRLGLAILLQGLLVGGVSLVAFGWTYARSGGNAEQARATAFCVLVYAELLRAIASRSQTYTLGQLGFFSNPYLLLAIAVSGMLQVSVAILPFTQRVFDVSAHTPTEWLGIALLALTPVTLFEVGKLARQRLTGQPAIRIETPPRALGEGDAT